MGSCAFGGLKAARIAAFSVNGLCLQVLLWFYQLIMDRLRHLPSSAAIDAGGRPSPAATAVIVAFQ